MRDVIGPCLTHVFFSGSIVRHGGGAGAFGPLLLVQGGATKPALAADKVSLFKVITAKDEIVIGLSADQLAQMDGNAGGVAKALVAKGSLTVSPSAPPARRPPWCVEGRQCWWGYRE